MNKIQKIFIARVFIRIENELKEKASASPEAQRKFDEFNQFMKSSVIATIYRKYYNENIDHLREIWGGFDDIVEYRDWSDYDHAAIVDRALMNCDSFLKNEVDDVEMGILEREGYLI